MTGDAGECDRFSSGGQRGECGSSALNRLLVTALGGLAEVLGHGLS